jgi:hypothetical protein
MTLFNEVSRTEADGAPPVAVTWEVGRTLGGVAIAIVVLGAALVLYLANKSAAAAGFFSLGEAIAVGVLGLSYGENVGAKSASNQFGR